MCIILPHKTLFLPDKWFIPPETWIISSKPNLLFSEWDRMCHLGKNENSKASGENSQTLDYLPSRTETDLKVQNKK